jgi:alkanesulfonate monooxygenase SsuD/methylene tetrahydromethanopterin reductase-like flavin-dependent oxidoreductase (luciferase family)
VPQNQPFAGFRPATVAATLDAHHPPIEEDLMKAAIMLPNGVPATSGRRIVDWAVAAEARGFDAIGVIDRVVYDSYEPLVTLAAAAAVTERIELVTDVLITPLRNTTMLAKQAASLDRLSGGRLTLGIGVGIREDDFTAVGASARDRGARFDRQLGELRRIWSGGTGIGPVPARPGGPQLLIGGRSAYAAGRVAEHADGWTMMVGSPDDFAAELPKVRAAWDQAGRADRPRAMAMIYVALGEQAEALAEHAIGHYYSWLGPELVGWVASTAVTDENALARRMDEFTAAGAEEIVLTPCSSDIAQLHLLADVALRAPALA